MRHGSVGQSLPAPQLSTRMGNPTGHGLHRPPLNLRPTPPSAKSQSASIAKTACRSPTTRTPSSSASPAPQPARMRSSRTWSMSAVSPRSEIPTADTRHRPPTWLQETSYCTPRPDGFAGVWFKLNDTDAAVPTCCEPVTADGSPLMFKLTPATETVCGPNEGT